MGAGRKGTGVEARAETLRITFTWRGERCRESIPLKPTPPNIRVAERMVADINEQIRAGHFSYAEWFPNSARAAASAGVRPVARDVTFRAYAERWLGTLAQPKTSPSTKAAYEKYLKAFWYPAIGERSLRGVTNLDLLEALASKAWASSKTMNNYLTPMRQVFNLALRNKLISSNPTEGIENAEVQTPEPSPLTPEEVDMVLAQMRKRYAEPVVNYFECAFFTGMRPSELIELRWGDIDWHSGKIQVRRARVVGTVKAPKTVAGRRDIELLSRARDALHRQKAFTLLNGPDAAVFCNPVRNTPWPDDKRQRQSYWSPTLSLCGLAQRDAYQTRHTFATMMIMRGANHMWLAKQMGHTSPKIIYKHYARWLDTADHGRELERIEAQMASGTKAVSGDKF